MRYFSLDESITLHSDIMRQMGALQGFGKSRIGYLESALQHIKNDDFYPTLLDKLTHLVFCCVKFYPFLDGNKRSAIYLAKAFLRLNAPKILPNDFYQKLENVVVSVASDKIDKDKLKAILADILGL